MKTGSENDVPGVVDFIEVRWKVPSTALEIITGFRLYRGNPYNYVPFIRSLLQDRFGDGPVTLSHLSARDIGVLSSVRRRVCTRSEPSS